VLDLRAFKNNFEQYLQDIRAVSEYAVILPAALALEAFFKEVDAEAFNQDENLQFEFLQLYLPFFTCITMQMSGEPRSDLAKLVFFESEENDYEKLIQLAYLQQAGVTESTYYMALLASNSTHLQQVHTLLALRKMDPPLTEEQLVCILEHCPPESTADYSRFLAAITLLHKKNHLTVTTIRLVAGYASDPNCQNIAKTITDLNALQLFSLSSYHYVEEFLSNGHASSLDTLETLDAFVILLSQNRAATFSDKSSTLMVKTRLNCIAQGNTKANLSTQSARSIANAIKEGKLPSWIIYAYLTYYDKEISPQIIEQYCQAWDQLETRGLFTQYPDAVTAIDDIHRAKELADRFITLVAANLLTSKCFYFHLSGRLVDAFYYVHTHGFSVDPLISLIDNGKTYQLTPIYSAIAILATQQLLSQDVFTLLSMPNFKSLWPNIDHVAFANMYCELANKHPTARATLISNPELALTIRNLYDRMALNGFAITDPLEDIVWLAPEIAGNILDFLQGHLLSPHLLLFTKAIHDNLSHWQQVIATIKALMVRKNFPSELAYLDLIVMYPNVHWDMREALLHLRCISCVSLDEKDKLLLLRKNPFMCTAICTLQLGLDSSGRGLHSLRKEHLNCLALADDTIDPITIALDLGGKLPRTPGGNAYREMKKAQLNFRVLFGKNMPKDIISYSTGRHLAFFWGHHYAKQIGQVRESHEVKADRIIDVIETAAKADNNVNALTRLSFIRSDFRRGCLLRYKKNNMHPGKLYEQLFRSLLSFTDLCTEVRVDEMIKLTPRHCLPNIPQIQREIYQIELERSALDVRAAAAVSSTATFFSTGIRQIEAAAEPVHTLSHAAVCSIIKAYDDLKAREFFRKRNRHTEMLIAELQDAPSGQRRYALLEAYMLNSSHQRKTLYAAVNSVLGANYFQPQRTPARGPAPSRP
jgi:hypothetical protein